MVSSFSFRQSSVYALRRLTEHFRTLSSVSHLTPAELNLYAEHLNRKNRISRQPAVQKPPKLFCLQSHIYDTKSSVWLAPDQSDSGGLERGRLLKLASWNIDWSRPDPAARASAALGHLNELFGETPGHLVVMLQEVRQESLQVILGNPWVQRNFLVSNVTPPESVHTNIPGQSFIMRRLDWMAAPYFTLILISRSLAITRCFRVPFVSSMGRDALVIDIPILNPGEQTRSIDYLRLCTTHLESLWPGKAYRPGQLALISGLLKGTLATDSTIIAGVVGGDMNAIDGTEHEFHKAGDVDMQDVWEDVSTPSMSARKLFQKDLTDGRTRGNTWGYQSKAKRNGKRMDKFYYTGLLEIVGLEEAQDITGRFGRIGMRLKTEVETWERRTENVTLAREKLNKKSQVEYLSDSVVARLQDSTMLENMTRKKVNMWVSDHFGITVGVKIS